MTLENNDNRYIPRWETQNKVVGQLEDAVQPLEGHTRDICSTGACIVTRKLPGLSRNLKLTIFLNNHTTVEADGKIIWTKLLDEQVEIGVRFSAMSTENQEILLEHAFQIDKKRFLGQLFKGWHNHKY